VAFGIGKRVTKGPLDRLTLVKMERTIGQGKWGWKRGLRKSCRAERTLRKVPPERMRGKGAGSRGNSSGGRLCLKGRRKGGEGSETLEESERSPFNEGGSPKESPKKSEGKSEATVPVKNWNRKYDRGRKGGGGLPDVGPGRNLEKKERRKKRLPSLNCEAWERFMREGGDHRKRSQSPDCEDGRGNGDD